MYCHHGNFHMFSCRKLEICFYDWSLLAGKSDLYSWNCTEWNSNYKMCCRRCYTCSHFHISFISVYDHVKPECTEWPTMCSCVTFNVTALMCRCFAWHYSVKLKQHWAHTHWQKKWGIWCPHIGVFLHHHNNAGLGSALKMTSRVVGLGKTKQTIIILMSFYDILTFCIGFSLVSRAGLGVSL